MPLALAFGLAAPISLLAYAARLLTASGTAAAALVGTAVLAGTGWWGGAVLLTYFGSASLVSRLAVDPSVARFDAKGSRRDMVQVLANGGWAGLLALLPDPALAFAGMAASLSVSAADTWATAAGSLSPVAPRSIATGQPVEPGSSGGVTIAGCLGAAVGASLVALVSGTALRSAPAGVFIGVIGMAGMLLDSALGATVQGRFLCGRCDAPTERRRHRCGSRTRRVGGLGWLDNDGVNAMATGAGALGGTILFKVCSWG